MRVQPQAADWEYPVGSDLEPHLVADGQPADACRPSEAPWLIDRAYRPLADGIGVVGLEDMLILPANVWPLAGRRLSERRSCEQGVVAWPRLALYCPLCVVGISARAVGLWAADLPDPGMRVRIPLNEIAMVETRDFARWHTLVITGREAVCLRRRQERHFPRGQPASGAHVPHSRSCSSQMITPPW